MHILELKSKTLPDLYTIAQELDLQSYTGLRKQELIFSILQAQTEKEGVIFGEGVLVLDIGDLATSPFLFIKYSQPLSLCMPASATFSFCPPGLLPLAIFERQT